MLKLSSNLFKYQKKFVRVARCEFLSNECQRSAFADIKRVPPVEIFNLTKLYQEDTYEHKVNLGVGAYRTEENTPYVFPVVKKCELEIVNDQTHNHEYLPMLGNPDFTKAATELVLDKNCNALKEKRVLGVQTLSGTGAIRLAADFMCKNMERRTCYMPNPTWENHFLVFKQAGFKHLKEYPYWNAKKRKLDISKLLATLAEAPEGAVVLLQSAGHNPTGCDPTKKQWKQIAEVMKQRKLFPFFDTAYQGFASGDPDLDAWPIRHFVKQRFETLIAQSFAKNMGLYNERIGNLVVVLNDKKHIAAVGSQITVLIRISYSTPPAFGSRIVAKVLSDECNRNEWLKTLCEIAERVKKLRVGLAERLKMLETPGKWDHIVKQRGMFAYLGLSQSQCEHLIKEKHIYLVRSGRINMCGINMKNIDYVANSISEVVKTEFEPKDCNKK